MKKLKGIIEVEFVQVGEEKIKDIKGDFKFKKAFEKNWKNIVKMTEQLLTGFYSHHKIKIKVKEKSEYVE